MWEAFIWAIFGAFLVFGGLGMTFNNYMMARVCFILAAFVPLARLSWWILVEHQFESKLWPYFLMVAIYGVISILLVYGLHLVSDQEHKFKKEMEASDKINKRVSILENIQMQASKNRGVLKKKYPLGYVIFDLDYQNKLRPLISKVKKYQVDWSVVGFTKVTSTSIELRLPDVIKDGKKLFTNAVTGGPKKVGDLGGAAFGDSDGMVFMWGEIIEIGDNGIVFLIGFQQGPPIPKANK